MSDHDDTRDLATTHAAEMFLIHGVEYTYQLDDSMAATVRQVAYDMAVEMLAVILDIDGEPAKAVLDREIARILGLWPNVCYEARLAPPTTPPLTFDQVEAAGLDGTLRRIA